MGFWTVQCHLFIFISRTPGVSASVDEFFLLFLSFCL